VRVYLEYRYMCVLWFHLLVATADGTFHTSCNNTKWLVADLQRYQRYMTECKFQCHFRVTSGNSEKALASQPALIQCDRVTTPNTFVAQIAVDKVLDHIFTDQECFRFIQRRLCEWMRSSLRDHSKTYCTLDAII
jgi:hypothetical protein